MKDTEVIERALSKKKKQTIPARDFLSSGSSLLNLSVSGRINCCFAKGHYYWFVGDSDSGKTFLTCTSLAEATLNENFDDYRLILDNAEDGALMDMEKFFGSKLVGRLEPPSGDKDDPKYSSTVEEFYFNLDDAIKDGRSFIYVLDSMDALDTDADKAKFQEHKKAYRKGREKEEPSEEDEDGDDEAAPSKPKGSYGMSKAKKNSEFLRGVVSGIKKTKSIVIIISQTRDNVGFGSMFDPTTVSGGRALKFYATLQMWSRQKMKLKRTVRGKKRQLGIISSVQIKKNRITGRDRYCEIPIYHSFGIDDVGSMINYLIYEKHWKGTKERVVAKEFDFSGLKEQLIEKIYDEELEKELKAIVSQVWNDIEEKCKVNRRRRYV